MPRTDNKATKSKSAWPSGLRFVASLLFLYVIFGGSSAGNGWWSPWVTSGTGSLWLPILFGLAVLTSIGLFFSSLAGLVFKGGMGMEWKVATMAAFALIALTASPAWSGIFWVVILGFVLSWFASGLEMM